MTDLSKINLGLIKSQAKGRRKTDLPKEELKKFITNVLIYESSNAEGRQEAYDNGDISEKEINEYDFYHEEGLTGIIIQLSKKNVLPVSFKKGETNFILEFYKKDRNTNEFIYDDNGDKILLNQILMKVQSRKGPVSLFVSRIKAREMLMDIDGRILVLTGRLSEKYYDLESKDYVSKKEEGKKYGDFVSYTLNVRQIGEIQMKTDGETIKKIYLPEVNWKKEENGDD